MFPGLLGTVSRQWATDKQGADLMTWFEAQRAIGELMLVDQGEDYGVKGFAAFSGDVGDFLPWLGEFKAALESHKAERSARLVAIQHALVELVRALDPEQLRFLDHLDLAVGKRSNMTGGR
jgi:nitrate reductase assembly molybdenum cofactor insertion protein NarJ